MRPNFIAEFTTNHMGNLNILLRMVEKAAYAGCDYIKMQKKDVETFYSKEKLDVPYISPYGKTYRDYRTIFEFVEEDFDRLNRKCQDLGIQWFSTVQDIPSLHFMLRYNLPIYKVASCNARNIDFLQEVARNVPASKAIVLSVAGSTLDEIEKSLNIFHKHRVHLLHCVAEYPCPPESLRLGNILVLKEYFACERISIGYSGHEEGITPTLAAIALGSTMIERHFSLSRHSFVHHIECSLEPQEYKELIDMVCRGVDLQLCYDRLPPAAFASGFGMSDVERSFLIDHTYGRNYIKEKSEFER
jgi:N-acetylneuraminate synthase